VTQLAISLIKNRRQETCGSRLKFVNGNTPDGRAGRPLPAAERGESFVCQQPPDGAHGVTRPTNLASALFANQPGQTANFSLSIASGLAILLFGFFHDEQTAVN